jgi:hypothetical protein
VRNRGFTVLFAVSNGLQLVACVWMAVGSIRHPSAYRSVPPAPAAFLSLLFAVWFGVVMGVEELALVQLANATFFAIIPLLHLLVFHLPVAIASAVENERLINDKCKFQSFPLQKAHHEDTTHTQFTPSGAAAPYQAFTRCKFTLHDIRKIAESMRVWVVAGMAVVCSARRKVFIFWVFGLGAPEFDCVDSEGV